ncbi:MAG: NADH-quinone oxidoreductase subunit NuoF [Fusobacteriaceae bacterium]|jgi:NADH-quinone oxidoreductase subunit F/NADP-reducing hydrogenase subunit HndC|nr:NADH-quinone oxidoreductase subunit NuoF [Fusobacteriaceae bacterium]
MEKRKIFVCGETGCLSSKSEEILINLKKVIGEYKLEDQVEAALTGCFGFCEKGPIVAVLPENNFYLEVKPEDAREIIESDIMKHQIVDRLIYTDPDTRQKVYNPGEIGFYRKQVRRVLKNCGIIDPENIEDFIQNDGYEALRKALTSMTREEIVREMKESRLRGRGGAGFPTGLKWEMAFNRISDEKYIVCNADEGDPGAFMDRSVLEGDPHLVIEGMVIGAYAIGAVKGFVYIRAEYPLAMHRLSVAIEAARRKGFLGKNIFGTDFSFDIELRLGAGAFVCGEETALLRSMEGKRGEPTSKPPYPIDSGYLGKPTVVNNVETFANVPGIILNGASWFKEVGTPGSPGTKVFALSGKIANVGLVEVPMGITLREIIFEIGGGVKNGKKFKAVQTGGPSGGCLSEADLDIQVDFDNLSAKGAIMGSGGMVVMDEDDCMVAIAKFFLEFTLDESCGKCTPCRVGNTRLFEILQRITTGNGKLEDIKLLKTLAETVKTTSLCGLGQTSPNPVLSTLQKFEDEYIAHIVEKRCPAKVCQGLLVYRIDESNCIGCTACAKVCPVMAITGFPKKPHTINQELCIKCGACYSACRFNAVNME